MIGSAAVVADELGDPVSGAPEYMAPEIVRGAVPTPGSDLYAAGVLLYELLTGGLPFRGRGPRDLMARHLEELLVPPSRRRPDREIGSLLDRVVLRALDKRPEARFADAASFSRAIRDVVARRTRTRLARGSQPGELGLRREIGDALVQGDVARIAAGYMRLAREMLRVRRIREAIRELEEGIDLVTGGAGRPAEDSPDEVAQLVAALASLRNPEIRSRA
jgi:hypothetical protein